jgi:hypothetical protein
MPVRFGPTQRRQFGAGKLDDAELDSALFAELGRLVDGQRVAQVNVIVVDGERRLGWRGRFSRWGDRVPEITVVLERGVTVKNLVSKCQSFIDKIAPREEAFTRNLET